MLLTPMALRRIAFIFGILTLGVSLATWGLDFADLTIKCIYCQNERTMMGLLGLLLIFPVYPYITRYLAYVFGFFGASVAAQQIMLVYKNSGLFSFKFVLVASVLFIIIAQVYLISLQDEEN
ncbi:MAG: hypothetical protein H0U57_03230 [Tatlockia sp.]|nr:hypothetical protein [Tatlockia sp.]